MRPSFWHTYPRGFVCTVGCKPELAADLVVVVVNRHQHSGRPETDYSGRRHGCEKVAVVPVVIAYADLNAETAVAWLVEHFAGGALGQCPETRGSAAVPQFHYSVRHKVRFVEILEL